MGVNDGSGSAISWSDIQSFYGGTNPISISEYNRGGTEVPSTTQGVVKNAASASNTASNQQSNQDTTTANIRVQRTYDPSVSQSGTGNNSNGVVNFGIGQRYWLNNQGTNAQVSASVGQTADSSDPNYNVRLNAGLNVNDDGQVTGCGGGSIVASGNTSGAVVWTGTVSPNQAVCVTGGNAGLVWNTLQQVSVPQWDFVLTNNGITVPSLSSNLGGAQASGNINAGATRVANNRGSSAWSWSHPAVIGTVNANTNIPNNISTGNPVNVDVFNDPGNAAG